MVAEQTRAQQTAGHMRERAGGTAAERLARLAALVAAAGPLHLREAARTLGVSQMTVRRDVATADGLLCLGGYITAAGGVPAGADYVLHREEQVHMEGKQAAAEAAVRDVRAGQTLFLDCGTTMPLLAAALPMGLPLTVVCYAFNVATIACRRPDTRVILLGGLYHPSSASFWSREGEAMLGHIGIDRAFISAGGIHAERGVSCSHFHEVPLKQRAMANAQEICLVADATKFDRVTPARFAKLSEFHRVVTDDALGQDARRRYGRLCARLEVAET